MPNNRYASRPATGKDADGGAAPQAADERLCVVPLVANAHVPDIEALIDSLGTHLARLGRQVLVVDAALSAPLAPELARLGLDWQAGVEKLGRGVDYFAARGLPMAYRDHHGSAARFIRSAQAAAPQANTILLHAEPAEMAHLLRDALQPGTSVRPILLGTDDGHSLQTTYSACKLLHQEAGLSQFDVLWAGGLTPVRAAHMADSLARCAQTYLGVTVQRWAMLQSSIDLAALLQSHLESHLQSHLQADVQSHLQSHALTAKLQTPAPAHLLQRPSVAQPQA